MSQSGVLAILEENKTKWFSIKELAELLSMHIMNVQNNTKRLRRSQLVNFKFVSGQGHSHYIYSHKEY